MKKFISDAAAIVGTGVVNILYPHACPVCGSVIDKDLPICRECASKIMLIQEPSCRKCGRQLLQEEELYCGECKKRNYYFDRGFSVFRYSGDIRESIYKFKYENARFNAGFYAAAAVEIYGRGLSGLNIDVIIPVPMYEKKKRKRGYNQAEVLAEELSLRLNIPKDTGVLKRIKNTVPQKELGEEQRRENLLGAFAVDRSKISLYRRVLLVDDIYTTGNTVDSCARLLKLLGVCEVYFLCAAAGEA